MFRSRLSAKTLKQIALSFWLSAPPAIVARNLQLNPKTVRRHYELLQQGIYRSEHTLNYQLDNFSGQEGFVLFVTSESAKVKILPHILAHDVKIGSNDYCCVYSGDIQVAAPVINAFCQIFIEQEIARRACQKAKYRPTLTRYSLLYEVTFRFNHRSNPGVTGTLYQFYKTKTV